MSTFLTSAGFVSDAAVGDRGVGHGHLERAGEVVALADGNVGGVGLGPFQLRIPHLHPFRPRHDAFLFVREADIVFLADAENLADPVDGFDSCGVSILIKKTIARDPDGVGEPERAVLAMLVGDPAFEVVVAVGNPAGAIVMVAANAFFEAGQCGDDLESGARRETADGAADQRHGFVIAQRPPIRGGDAGDEDIGIEGRDGGHGEDVAIVWVDHDGGGAADRRMPERLFSDHLDAGVEREIDVVTRLGGSTRSSPSMTPLTFLLQDADAGFAAQILVHAGSIWDLPSTSG